MTLGSTSDSASTSRPTTSAPSCVRLSRTFIPDESGTLVINVRRGDYYTEFIDKYAFDQAGYVCAALERVRSGGAGARRVGRP